MQENSSSSHAPLDTGGACGSTDGDPEFVEAPSGWALDSDGYPPEAGVRGVGNAPAPASGNDDSGDVGVEMERDTDPESNQSLGAMLNQAGSHLDELRRRVVISLLSFIPCFGVGLWLYQALWRLVILPLDRAAPHLTRFQALGPSDGLVMAMRIAFAFALIVTFPVWMGQVWSFVAPGLTAKEKRWLYASLGAGTVLFTAGVALAYAVGVPFALDYLLSFNQSLPGWENAFTGSGYVDFVITACIGFGLAFELPLVMLVLGWVGLLTPEGIRAWWRPIILILFVVAAVITPPDPFTQMMLAIPMLCLFALGYSLVKWVGPAK